MARSVSFAGIESLSIQRRLSTASSRLTEASERLSSGLRINRASDDSAGLAIASNLSLESRVYNQAVRNVNDSISVLSIVEGSLRELSEITIRLSELAEQASNGVLSVGQRRSINAEGVALVDEFNRITRTTSVNGRSFLEDPSSSFSIQQGFGSSASLFLNVASELARNVGDGTYQTALSLAIPNTPTSSAPVLADVDADGMLDILLPHAIVVGATSLGVLFGNGDGSFQAAVSYSTGSGGNKTGNFITAGDFNGDGYVDVWSSQSGIFAVNSAHTVFLNDGTGRFNVSQIQSGSGGSPSTTADFNGDGRLDIISGTSIFFGNGDGTFHGPRTVYGIEQGTTSFDWNSDGKADLFAPINGGFGVYVGNGDGSFSAGPCMAGAYPANAAIAQDFNHDGLMDFAVASYNSLGFRNYVSIYVGNTDGTFSTTTTTAGSFGGPISQLAAADFNKDGFTDFVSTVHGVLFVGNGDGTFSDQTWAPGTSSTTIAVGDIRGLGVVDIVRSPGLNLTVLSANFSEVTTMPRVNLSSAETARSSLYTVQTARQRVVSELAACGSHLSRLAVGFRQLSVLKEQTESAESQIRSSDIAEESAQVVKGRILQEAASSLLAQANLQPQLALALLT